MGHRSIRIALDTSDHLFPGLDEHAAAALGRRTSETPKSPAGTGDFKTWS
jgi:hypothetical protein